MRRTTILSLALSLALLLPALSAPAKDDLYEQLKPLMESLSLIQSNYVDVDKTASKDLVGNAIKGMVQGLDPYSQYMDAQSNKDMKEETTGEFGGIGIEIAIKGNQLTVVSPIEGTPAFKAGIKSGDAILKIDAQSTEGMAIMDAVHKMRGIKGTNVTITIGREGLKAPKEYTLSRDTIHIQNVKASWLDGNVAYIRLSQFMGETVDEEFAKGVAEAKRRKAAGLVVDLRNNPGGLLDMAARIASNFVPKGELVVYTDGRIKSQNKKFFSQGGEDWKGPLVLLVNGGSASASEILSGAIQDHGLGVLVGTRTFGKGSVQTIIELSDHSGLRLTTAGYFTPKGRKIHGKGIEPDVVCEEEVYSSQVEEMLSEDAFSAFTKQSIASGAAWASTATAEALPEDSPDVKVSESNWEHLKPETREQKMLKDYLRWCEARVKDFREDQFWADKGRITTELKRELARRQKGDDEARKVELMGDPQIQQALAVVKVQNLGRARAGKD